MPGKGAVDSRIKTSKHADLICECITCYIYAYLSFMNHFRNMLYVKVMPSDPKNIAFYERYGFKQYDNYSALVVKNFRAHFFSYTDWVGVTCLKA